MESEHVVMDAPVMNDPAPGGYDAVSDIREGCTECLACLEECEFLKRTGTPKEIASRLDTGRGPAGTIPFECSLCRLCDAVCPEGLSPADLFLALRAEGVMSDPSILARFSRILRYERMGSSRLLSLRAFPDGCDTVFFPGCNLPGTMPGATERLVREMSRRIPRLGIVLDCCNRPSHDLGRVAFFIDRFKQQASGLRSRGVSTLITACPNCHDIFSRYATGLRVVSAFTLMAGWGLATATRDGESLAIHDPCALRFRDDVAAATRKMLSEGGVAFTEMAHGGRTTLCCGEGGAVGAVNGEYPDAWGKRIALEAAGRTVVTCCGGCRDRLSRFVDARHLLELWSNPEDPGWKPRGVGGRVRFPFTTVNRLLFKMRIARIIRGG